MERYQHLKGYSLLELLIALLVFSIVAHQASTPIRAWVDAQLFRQQTFQMQRALNLARENAIYSGNRTVICPLDVQRKCMSDWNAELTVFEDKNNNHQLDSDERVLHTLRPITHANSLRSFNNKKIGFNRLGFAGFANGSFSFCLKSHTTKAIKYVISRPGRVRVEKLDSRISIPCP